MSSGIPNRKIPATWTWIPLSRLLREPLRNGHSAKVAAGGAGIRTLTLTAVTRGNFSEQYTKITSADSRKVRGLWLQPGDLLIQRSNTRELVGTARVFRGAADYAIYPDLLIRARLVREVSEHYVEYFLASGEARSYFQQRAQGIAGGMPKIDQEIIENLWLPIAPREEQERIVNKITKILSETSAGVSALEKANVKIARYRTSVLNAALEGRLVPNNAGRGGPVARAASLESKSLTQRADVPDIGELRRVAQFDMFETFKPSTDWSWTTLGHLLERIETGKSFKCLEQPPQNSEVGVVKVSAVTWGVFDEEESKTCEDPARIDPVLFVREGDFLFSRANTIELVGACVIAGPVQKKLMLSDKILRFKFASEVRPKWVLWILRSQFGRTEIERLATGNQESMRNIGQERIRQIRIPLPPLAQQDRIVEEVERRLAEAEHLTNATERAMQRAERLQRSLFKLAFEGKLVPQEPLDEPTMVTPRSESAFARGATTSRRAMQGTVS